MPWEVKPKGDEYCVYKKGSSSPIKGGCHPTEAAAKKHMKALYANVEGEVLRIKDFFRVRRMGPRVAADKVALVTIPNVPIVSTGIDYPLGTGNMTFTAEDLSDAVIAAEEDPHIRSPRLKLGYNKAHGQAITEPSFGTVTNLRLGDNGQTVYGDFVGVPEWLAEVMPVAYPSRSIEGNKDVQTVGGKKYKFIIDQVALLGVNMPGVTCLEDLPLLYGKEMPEGVEIAASGAEAAVNVDDVRRRYYEEIDNAGPEYSYWWVRAMELEDSGGYLIVDDNKGDLFKVDFTISGEDVTYDEPSKVKVQYVAADQEARQQLAADLVAGMAVVREGMTTYATRAESRPANATQEGGQSLDLKELATKLGLPEDASEEQVSAKLAQLQEHQPTPDPAEGTNPPEPDTTTGGTTGPSPENPPAGGETAQGPTTHSPTPPNDPEVEADGTVKLDAEQYRTLMASAESVRKRDEADTEKSDKAIVAEAAKQGRIPVARKAHYLGLMQADREGTTKLLTASAEEGGLAPGLIPVDERGSGGEGNAEGWEAAEGLPESWFGGAIEAARARAEHSGRVVLAKEG